MAKVGPLQTDPFLPSPNLKNHNLLTPVIVERLDFFLSGYNHSIAAFLSSGFREGFPLHYEGDPVLCFLIRMVKIQDDSK